MSRRTPLHQAHGAAGAKLVDFGGWEMPLNYGSQIEEHHAVRRGAGMFDVSHMTVVDVEGPQAEAFLRQLLANDVAKLKVPGKALYSCMLAEDGGILDDLITYRRGDDRFRLVVNAATRDSDLAWMAERVASFDATLSEREDLAMIAVQGPAARERASALIPEDQREAVLAIKPFSAIELGELFVARTGYTGEDGFEITLPGRLAAQAWSSLLDAGVVPCGLGARDTLRLEAGMNLYGSDMDPGVSPLESGLAWTVAFDPAERAFTGRAALEAQRDAGPTRQLVGLLLEGRGVLRGHQVVHTDAGQGEVTSGTYSPTLERSIAFARLPASAAAAGAQVEVEIRGKRIPARITPQCFVRHGQPQFEI